MRRAQQLIINFTLEINKRDTSNSRTTRLTSYDSDHIATQSIDVICNYSNLLDKNSENILLPIKHLGLHAGKFVTKNDNGVSITSFFNKIDTNKTKVLNNTEDIINKTSVPNDTIKNKKEDKYIDSFFLKNNNQNDDKHKIKRSTNNVEKVECENTKSININQCDNVSESIECQILQEKLYENVVQEDDNTTKKEIVDISSSSFFLKCYQQNIQELENDVKHVEPAILVDDKPSCSKTSKIELILPQANTSFHSDDSYSSTYELESILKKDCSDPDSSVTSRTNTVSNNEHEQQTSYIDDYELALRLSKEELGRGLQKCEECGKDVLDMVTHMDRHLALKISNQQREEFRLQQKQNFSPACPNKEPKNLIKKRKKGASGIENKGKKTKSIISFFNKD